MSQHLGGEAKLIVCRLSVHVRFWSCVSTYSQKKRKRENTVTWTKWGICLAGSLDNEALVSQTRGCKCQSNHRRWDMSDSMQCKRLMFQKICPFSILVSPLKLSCFSTAMKRDPRAFLFCLSHAGRLLWLHKAGEISQLSFYNDKGNHLFSERSVGTTRLKI